MIPDEAVERVREAADIVEIIGEHVKLRRTGADWRGPCPFHQGKNPNFAVSPRKGIYHCYKCGVSGDVFTFLREQQGLSFVDAVKQLGDRYGVVVPDSGPRGGQRERDDREPLWETLGAAADFFRDQLWESEAGAAARDYLHARNIGRELAERFGLGFAPPDPAALRSRLHALGMDDARQLEVGLLVQRDDGSVRQRFRSRLMFPITDASGNLSGFGGRLIGPGEPKYLNSPETRVFVKGRLLYNLHAARSAMRRDERALVVEGYFDVIRLAAAGFDSTVAPLGTALTETQAQLLQRYTGTTFLLYDSDEAGLKATFRAGLELLRQGVAVRVVTLPDGEDPDTFLDRHGAERFERYVANALDLFERQLQLVERAGWFADLSRKRHAVDRLLPTIRAAADALTRDLYLARLADVTGIDRATLQREVDEPSTRRGQGRSTAGAPQSPPPQAPGPSAAPHAGGWRPELPPAPGVRPRGGWRDRGGRGRDWRGRGRGDGRDREELMDSAPPRPGAAPTRGAERTLVLAMLHLEGYIESVAQRVRVESFRDPVYAELFAVLTARGEAGDVEAVAEELSPAAVVEYERLLEARDELTAPRQIVDDSLAMLRLFELRDQIEEVARLAAIATGEKREALELEHRRLMEEKKALGARGNWARKLGT